ncbi:uncharacterized protein ACNS7B_019372 isoform 1-T1 [Menidia menidia]
MDLSCSSFFIPDGLEHGNLVVVKCFSLIRVLGVSVAGLFPSSSGVVWKEGPALTWLLLLLDTRTDLSCSSFFIPDGLEHGNLVVVTEVQSDQSVGGLSETPAGLFPSSSGAAWKEGPALTWLLLLQDTRTDLSCSSFFIPDGLEHGNLVVVTEVQSDQVVSQGGGAVLYLFHGDS